MQGAEFQVNTYTTGNQSFPTVAANADGKFVVAWASDHAAGDASETSVHARLYHSGGTPAALRPPHRFRSTPSPPTSKPHRRRLRRCLAQLRAESDASSRGLQRMVRPLGLTVAIALPAGAATTGSSGCVQALVEGGFVSGDTGRWSLAVE